MSRKKLWTAAAVLAVLLVWLFQNASLSRLRAEFIPWVDPLTGHRGAGATRRAAPRGAPGQRGKPKASKRCARGPGRTSTASRSCRSTWRESRKSKEEKRKR